MTRPNIVLISVDSLRADHCGHLGDDRGLTPTMDALADDGVAFQNAIAPGPQTFSSMPVAFTGEPRPPDPAGDGGDEWERRMAAIAHHVRRHRTLPERLRERGYTTAAFSPNPWTSTASGFDRGFDRFVDVAGLDAASSGSRGRLRGKATALARRAVGDDSNGRTVEIVLNLLGGDSFFAQWESFYDELAATVSELPEPYFLWVFLLDTHFPFVTSRSHRREQSAVGMYYGTLRSHAAMRGRADSMPESATRRARASYRDTVRAADAFLERLHGDLADDDPVTVVHSDHGESFGEHGNYGHHHRHVHAENVDVPYVVHGLDDGALAAADAGPAPDVAEPTTLATLPALLETVADERPFDPTEFTDDAVVASSECGRHRAARGERYKLVDCHGDRALYDLQTDPGETTDVSEDRPAVARRLGDALDAHEAHVTESARLDHATHQLLDAGAF